MTAAIAKLFDGVPEKGGVFRGTAFAVSREVGLTAFHCVGNRESGEVLVKRVVLLFRGDMRDIKIEAEVEKGDHRADFALLRFLGSLPDVLQPIPLTRGVAPHAPFRCAGYPPVLGPDIIYSHGEVVAPETTIFGGADALQLYSNESAAKLSLHGMSGSPVLVGELSEAAVGLIRWNPESEDNPDVAVGGTVYACPIRSVLKLYPDLEHYVTAGSRLGGSSLSREDLLKIMVTAATLPPKISDLFEIIHDPADVRAAIFRTGPDHGLPHYQIPYVMGREGVSNVQDALYEALIRSGGGLLVQSRSGVGKTREVAELAARLCEQEDWTVCVATGDGDARMGALAAFPDDLRSRRLLFVLDDLHQRVLARDHDPYTARLNAFLEFLDHAMLPGKMYIVATARTEPRHQKHLGFDRAHPLWSRFKVYELPEYSLSGLQSLLAGLAEWAKVEVESSQIKQMVSNSDRSAKTLLLNVHRAQRSRERLTLDKWFPTQGKSWGDSFKAAQGRWPDIERVYQALHLIREAGLPTRFRYVAQLGAKLGGAEATLATEGLVDRGLLGLRAGLLDVFGDEELRDSLGAAGQPPAELGVSWEPVIESILAEVRLHPEWASDLVALAARLVEAKRFKDAESTATAALDNDQVEAYTSRIAARYSQNDSAGAEADCTAAIARGRDDSFVYFSRGMARFGQRNYAGAEADYTAAIDRGRDDAWVYHLRAMPRMAQGNIAGAQADYAAAIERGDDLAYFGRAGTRFAQGNCEGAEADYTAVIERGFDWAWAYASRGGARDAKGDYVGAEADCTAALARGLDWAVVYLCRGQARLSRNDYVAAEADLTTAIQRGWDGADAYFGRGRARYGQKNYSGAEADYTAAIQHGQNDAEVYFLRGRARFDYDDAAAEADFTAAIERGRDDASVYLLRGWVQKQQGKFAGAEADLTAAIERGQDGPAVYCLRGLARYGRADFAVAEADLTAAIERGPEDPEFYYRRGTVRSRHRDYAGAESDFTDAIQHGKDDAEVYLWRAQVRVNCSDYAGAEEDFTSAIARGQNNGDVYFRRGAARLERGDKTGAEADFTVAIERGQDGPGVYYMRGVMRLAQNNYSDAETDFTAAVARGQEDAGVYQARAHTRIRLKRFEAAKQDCEQAETGAPDDHFTHGRWGDLHLALGEYDAAIARYQSALKAASDKGWHFELGLALLLAGRCDEAKAAYEKGLTEAPATEVEAALRELDSATRSAARSVGSIAVKEAVNAIRQKLEAHLSRT